jgi:hypothetical protein
MVSRYIVVFVLPIAYGVALSATILWVFETIAETLVGDSQSKQGIGVFLGTVRYHALLFSSFLLMSSAICLLQIFMHADRSFYVISTVGSFLPLQYRRSLTEHWTVLNAIADDESRVKRQMPTYFWTTAFVTVGFISTFLHRHWAVLHPH